MVVENAAAPAGVVVAAAAVVEIVPLVSFIEILAAFFLFSSCIGLCI